MELIFYSHINTHKYICSQMIQLRNIRLHRISQYIIFEIRSADCRVLKIVLPSCLHKTHNKQKNNNQLNLNRNKNCGTMAERTDLRICL